MDAHERRRRRSNDLATALRYQLEVAASRVEADAMVLADDEGLIIASVSAEDFDAAMFANMLPEVAGSADPGARMFPDSQESTRPFVVVRAFVAGGRAFVLGAIGPRGDLAAEALNAARGARRLMS